MKHEEKVKFKAWGDADVLLDIGGDQFDKNQIMPEHTNAYNFAVENQEGIKNKILEFVFNFLQNDREGFLEIFGYSADDGKNGYDEMFPEIHSMQELEKLIKLDALYILNVHHSGIAYTGYSFNCQWDEEHGLGVLAYKDRIADIGQGDISFANDLAEDDLRKNYREGK